MTQKYIPTKWVANETIGTANVMNNIEQGIVGAYDEIERVDSQLAHIEKSKIVLREDENLNESIDNINRDISIELSNYTYKAKPFELNYNANLENGVITFDGLNIIDYNSVIYIENKSDITFKNIKFILDNYASLNKVVRGIVFINCHNIRLKNVSLYDFTDQSIRFQNCSNIVIDNCYFSNSNNLSLNTSEADDDYGAIAIFSSNNVKVINSTFENCGTGMSIFDSSNVSILNNDINGNIENISAMGVYILGDSSEIIIDNNIISNFKNEGIVATNIGSVSKNIYNITITNNVIKDCLYCLLSLDVNVKDVIISNNTFIVNEFIPSNSIIQISNSVNINLNSNTLKNISNSLALRGIYLNSGNECIIESNFIEGNIATCIDVNKHKNHYIKSNTIQVSQNNKGVSIYPVNATSCNQIVGNIIVGDSSTVLIERRVTENLRYYLMVENLMQGGKVNLSPTQNCWVYNNIFKNITSDSIINDNGNTVIKNNIGYDDNKVFITDVKPSYEATGSERGRILQVQTTNDYLVYVRNNDGVYKYNRIAIGVGNIDNSTAENVETLKDDFNKLLGKLRVSGVLS